MLLNTWHCPLDADLALLLPASLLLQVEQNLPIYPLPVPTPNPEKDFLSMGLHWWHARWLPVFYRPGCKFFAVLSVDSYLVSLGLTALPEKIQFTADALLPSQKHVGAWQQAFPRLTLADYQKLFLGEVLVDGQHRSVMAPDAFLQWIIR